MIPIVSIIIPTFNRECLIQKTLQSVLKQTFQNWECIIIDDGSIDQTETVVKSIVENDSRFTYLKRSNTRKKGASTCRNIGLEHAIGKYIQFLDSDDIISDNKINEQVVLLNNEDFLTISTNKWGRFDKEFQLYEDLPSYKNFQNIVLFLNSLPASKGYFPPHCYLIPRELINISGPWNEYISLNDDGEFMMRILSNCKQIVFSSGSISWYRSTTENNLSNLTDYDSVERAIYSWMLIESKLAIRFGKEVDEFIKWSKNRFYINVKSREVSLINKFSIFFADQIKEDRKKKSLKYWIYSLVKKWLR